MARLKLLEQTQAVWMLMMPVNKKEPYGTGIQLSSEISTRPRWDPTGPWQRIDTELIVLALQRAVCTAQPGENSRDLSPAESGKLIVNTETEQSLGC